MRSRSAPMVKAHSSRYSKRLAIVIPYRNRRQHFLLFVPHMLNYFRLDKLDCQIDYELHIVEQADDKPFNRGMLKNVGFGLVEDKTDYVCFHDIDYLPLWADYSFSEQPARLIWHGLMESTTSKKRPQGAPSRANFFGGVVMFSNAHFRAVNGYPNVYWGWGAEDTELRKRCGILALSIEHRDGTYRALPHEHHGFKPGTMEFNEEAARNYRLFTERLPRLPELMKHDGLSSLNFSDLDSAPVTVGSRTLNQVIVHRVCL